MKKCLLLVSTRKKRESHLHGLMRLWSNNCEIECDASSLEELSFTVDEGVRINTPSGTDVAEYDLVVFRTVGARKREAVAVAHYCQKQAVKYIDSMIDTVGAIDDENKLAEMIALELAGVSIPRTFYGSPDHIRSWSEKTGYPFVLKAIDGKKGRDNYLVKSPSMLNTLLVDTSDANLLAQSYIPNDEDYRVLVLNYENVVITKRTRQSDDTHLNNVSVGGQEMLVDTYDGLEDIIDTATRAATALSIEVAGVDIVVDKYNGRPYVMEVNRAPELTLPEELDAYARMVERIAAEEGA